MSPADGPRGRAGPGRVLLAAAALAAAPSAGSGQEHCTSAEARVRVDHVPIAVADLEAATTRLVDGFGFRTKPGRRHANGLENRHIKFADGTGLELVTIHEPGDDLARRYAELIADGGGGAFVALGGLPVDSVLALVAPAEPELEATRLPAFDLAAFPPGHPLAPVFFVDVHLRPPDLPEHLDHPNGARSLRAVWVAVEEPDRLAGLLRRLGARDCGQSAHPMHLTGRAMGLARSTLYLVDAARWQADPGSAPVLSITVAGSDPSGPAAMVLPDAGGLWIQVEVPRP